MANDDTRRELVRSAATRWDAFWYSVVWWLGSLQALVLRHCVRQPLWRSSNGVVRTPQMMTSEHLANAILYCQRKDETGEPIYAALVAEAQRRHVDILNQRRLRVVGRGLPDKENLR